MVRRAGPVGRLQWVYFYCTVQSAHIVPRRMTADQADGCNSTQLTLC